MGIMASNSTPIGDLPRTDENANIHENEEENMMVNSILKDIENDNEIDNTNDDSLNYTIDTSQIPPKIGNELPSVETIQETTKTIFNEPEPTPEYLSESNNEKTSEIDDFLNQKINDTNKIQSEEFGIIDKIKQNMFTGIILFISFFIISLPFLNSLVIKYIPKLTSNGEISLLCILIKSIIITFIYGLCSIFL